MTMPWTEHIEKAVTDRIGPNAITAVEAIKIAGIVLDHAVQCTADTTADTIILKGTIYTVQCVLDQLLAKAVEAEG